MQKIADFIVNKRVLLFIVTIALAVLCGVFTALVPVNNDMTKYLADDSNMQQGLTIMNAEFPDAEEESSFRVMFDDLSDLEIDKVKKELEAIPHVSSVAYEADSLAYNKDNHTLFIVNTKCDYDTDEAASIQKALDSDFATYQMQYTSNNIQATTVPFGLIALALGVMLLVLFIMSESWLEPVLYMVAIGIAVVINLGTNIFFPYTSEITVSMGPILQLALSMDYSIMLMNRYRQELAVCGDKKEAMKAALAKSVTSVASSCITTVVGLLALVFLSFKLGPELGIVLAKGVLFSMLCVFIVLPFLILKFSDAIDKSKKKYPHIHMGLLAKGSYKARFAMPLIFIGLFATFAVLQGNTGISFTEGNPDAVAAVFPKDNTVILIYNNEDEEGADEIVRALGDNDRITSIVGYHNTLGEQKTAEDMSTAIAAMSDGVKLDEEMIKLLYYLYYSGETPSVTVENFIAFIKEDVLSNDLSSAYLDEGMNESIAYLEKFGNKEMLTKEMTAEEMAAFFGIGTDNNKRNTIEMLYLYYAGIHNSDDSWTMNIPDLFNYLCGEVVNDERFSDVFDRQTKENLLETKMLLDDGLAQMRSTDYSRLVLVTDYPEESAETSAFVAALDNLRKTELHNDSYIIGTSVMVYEMENSFSKEFSSITIITAIAIFIVILLSFRNAVLSVLLTLLVQGSVFITVTFIGWQGGSMYYLALLIVQSILMGATVDYAIVLSSYYREYRTSLNKVAALKAAYNGSIHTVATSGSILILATAVLGMFSAVAITAQVSTALSIGSLIAVLLILLVLPAMLVSLDKLIVKRGFSDAKTKEKTE